jgi:hypothetical protein
VPTGYLRALFVQNCSTILVIKGGVVIEGGEDGGRDGRHEEKNEVKPRPILSFLCMVTEDEWNETCRNGYDAGEAARIGAAASVMPIWGHCEGGRCPAGNCRSPLVHRLVLFSAHLCKIF